MKRIGDLNERVMLLRATESQNSVGEPIATWSVLAQVWAAIDYMGGSEAVSGNREYLEVPVTVWVRLSSQTQSLREKDRVMVPVGYTTLAEPLATTADTSLVVDDGSVFPPENEFAVRVGSEIMLVSSISSDTLTVTRGDFGTTAAVHSPGDAAIQLAPLDIVSVARHRSFLELTGTRSEVRVTA